MSRKTSIYSTDREDLLGAIAGAITAGAVKSVRISASAKTGMTAYSTVTGKAEQIIMPREENLPEGCTMQAAQGLLDHEMGHVRYTFLTPEMAKVGGLVQNVANILEDPREEILMAADFEGAGENIDALNEVGLPLTQRAMLGSKDPLTVALAALGLTAYGRDAEALLKGHKLEAEVLPFLTKATPLVKEALASEDTAGVYRVSVRIVAMLQTPKPPTPKPQPKPQSKPKPEQGDEQCGQGGGEGEGEDSQPQEGGDESSETKPKKGKSKKADSKPEKGDESDDDASAGSKPEKGEDDPSEGEKAEGQDSEGDDAEGEGDDSSTEDGADDAGEGSPDSKPEKGERKSGEKSDAGSPGSGASEPSEGEAGSEGEPENLETELARAAREAEATGRAPEKVSPAELVLALLAPAMEIARTEAKKAEAAALLEAAKSGLMVPLGHTPTSWARMEQEEVLPAAKAEYASALDELRMTIAGVRHALRNKLIAQNRTQVVRGLESGRLNSHALHHIPMGTSNRVFKDVVHSKSGTTAVTLLVDNSGSMGCAEKYIHARKAAVVLHEALDRLPGITTEILGFTTTYGGVCAHKVAKTFKSRDASPAMHFTADAGNADGVAVRWAARRSLAHKADRRILIVLSDGRPTDGAADPSADLRAAVEAATRHGVETYGIGVCDASVSAFYPQYVVIYDAKELCGAVLQALAKMIGEPKARPRARVA